MSPDRSDRSNALREKSKFDNVEHSGDPETTINVWLQRISNQAHGKDWMNELVPQLRIHSLQPAMPHPAASFLLTIQREHCNNMGTLHGGCTATLFDICTTLPLAFVTRPGYWEMLGVSRTLSITYISAARVGDEVLIECEVLHIGSKLAAIKGVMRNKSDNKIIATCEHGKYSADFKAKV